MQVGYLVKKLLILVATLACLGLSQTAHAGIFIDVQLDQHYYDSSHEPFPYFYHYIVSNSGDSEPALSHWSLYIPCMHSGSTDLDSINDPLGFSHEAPTFSEPGSGATYYGIKWEDIPDDGLEPLEPGESVSCFGFYSNLPQGMVDWRAKGADEWAQGRVKGPEHIIPEPVSLFLLGLGLLGLVDLKRKRS
jgi:hypothetical protein